MGFKMAWIGCSGKMLDEMIENLGLLRTGEYEDEPEAEYDGIAMESGWSLVINNYASGEFLLNQDLDRVHRGCQSIVVYVNETMMMSHVTSRDDGFERWSITHDAEKGARHLDVTGEPPAPFAAIRNDKVEQQNASDGGVDYMFEAPLDLAEAITGFRHDRYPDLSFELLEFKRSVGPYRARKWFGLF